MGRKNKLKKFSENLSFPNVFEHFDMRKDILLGKDGAEVQLKGQWHEQVFGNKRPITLELACGRGEYSLGLAARFPERNFLGVDIKGARIWRGAKNAIDQDLNNVAFLRTRIEKITELIAPEEIADIWITFPDPFLAKPNRRLTAPAFLQMYQQILTSDGSIHLKTDSIELYEFTQGVLSAHPRAKMLQSCRDIYSMQPLPHLDLDIQTYYEKMHLQAGKRITWTHFRLS